MSEPMTDPGGAEPPAEQAAAPPPAAPDVALLTDTASRVARYARAANGTPAASAAADAPSQAPTDIPAEPPTQQWSIDDPWVQDLIQERAEEMSRQLLATEEDFFPDYEEGFTEEGFPQLEPAEAYEFEPQAGELETIIDEIDRTARVEEFEQNLQVHEQLAEIVTGWVGPRVDAGEVIGVAADAFQAATDVGYQFTPDQTLEFVRTIASEFAARDQALARGEQTIGEQIASEAQAFTLLENERPMVRDIAEEILPMIASRSGAADGAAAREAVHQAARIVASQPDRPIESARERVFKFGRQFEEQRKHGGPSDAARRAAVVQQWNAVIGAGGRR